jgi:hypothetical protein
MFDNRWDKERPAYCRCSRPRTHRQRQTKMLIGLMFLLAAVPLGVSQDATLQPCPEVRPGALGCELIAWTKSQAPEPLPEPDGRAVPPSDERRDPQSGQSTSSELQASRQSIAGIIVRQGEKFVLKAGDDTTYQLDDQIRAGQYEDKPVKIVGSLEVPSNTLHIESIAFAT